MRSVVGRRVSVSVIAGVLLLVACSSDDSVSEELVSTTVAVEETATTAATTTSTIASTTTSTSTTTTTTVPETTTTTEPEPVVETVPNTDVDGSVPDSGPPDIMDGIEIPVNTMFDPATPEGEVEQAVLADNEAYKICLRDLQNCDLDAVTRFTFADVLEGRTSRVSRRKDAGQIAENADSIDVVVTGMRFAEQSPEVEVQVCLVDDSRFVLPATESAPRQVVTEGFISAERQYLLIRIDGQWLLRGTENLQTASGEENNLCAEREN